MVDFNNEATIGTPRHDILSVLILQRRNDVIEAIESFKKIEYQGGEGNAGPVRARLLSLFLEVRAAMKNSLKADDFAKLERSIGSTDMSDVSKALTTIDEWLYAKNITRIDNRAKVDTDDIEAVNKSHGLG